MSKNERVVMIAMQMSRTSEKYASLSRVFLTAVELTLLHEGIAQAVYELLQGRPEVAFVSFPSAG